MVARVGLALVAVLALAWLGLMERSERLQARATHEAVDKHIVRAQADLASASKLNPDTQPDVVRALLYIGLRQRGNAIAGVEAVVRREPDNLAAWGQLFRLAQGADPAAAARARAAILRLDPLAARSSHRAGAR